jgi:ubiquinone biosynthesis protein
MRLSMSRDPVHALVLPAYGRLQGVARMLPKSPASVSKTVRPSKQSAFAHLWRAPDNTMISRHQRYRQILAVLARHGIGVLDDQFIRHEAGDRARAEHLRRACEELGTMFIKLGQVLSTRGDLLPDAYRTELAKLQDEVAPLPGHVISGVIQEDLGAPPDRTFAFFDPEPLGSASIGQVHAARLSDGREVVIKVRKPGVDELVQIDLDILARLVEAWSPRFPILEQYDARGLVREFSDALREELDYSREAAHARFFRDLFPKELGFAIPEVIDEYSRNRVLTEERVKGRNLSAVAEPPGPQRAAVSRPVEGREASGVHELPKARQVAISHRIVRFVLEPAFERGVFYADPHPGNLLIQEDGTLAVVDFGKVGRLTPEVRRRVADTFVAIARSDAQRLTDRLVELTAPTQPIDRAVITHQIDQMLRKYVDVSLGHVRIGEAMEELLQLIRRHGLRVPGNLVQFFKALAMCEGILLAIDPDSSFADYLQPMVGKVVYQQFVGAESVERLRDSAIDAAKLGLELPGRLDRVLGEIERGNLRVWTRVEDVELIIERLEHMVARACATILAAACIVGLAIVMQFYNPQGWQRWIGAVFWIAVAFAVIDSVRTLLTLRRRP